MMTFNDSPTPTPFFSNPTIPNARSVPLQVEAEKVLWWSTAPCSSHGVAPLLPHSRSAEKSTLKKQISSAALHFPRTTGANGTVTFELMDLNKIWLPELYIHQHIVVNLLISQQCILYAQIENALLGELENTFVRVSVKCLNLDFNLNLFC